DDDAAMIEKIVTDVSNKLNDSTTSNDSDSLVGSETHVRKMKSLLSLESNEVRMVGIWGPAGIGKTTIARTLYKELASKFTHAAFIESIEGKFEQNHQDAHAFKLHLQKQLLSETLNQKDIKVDHLGVAKARLKGKKVLVFLDDVDELKQLQAMTGQTCWFGPQSRIITTTKDKKLLVAHEINHIYHVDFPSTSEALEILCLSAFRQNSPPSGFKDMAIEVTRLAGNLPLGLRVLGAYLLGMSRDQWIHALPRLRTSLDGEIEKVLRFSYDALCEDVQELFLHIACFFNGSCIDDLVECLAESRLNVKYGLQVLYDKCFISELERGCFVVHNLMEQLANEIVRKQSVSDPGKRQFLVDAQDICDVLEEKAGTETIRGIDFDLSEVKRKLVIDERAFEGMHRLQFLRFQKRGLYENTKLLLPQGLNFRANKLKFLEWYRFPLTCFPREFQPRRLVKLKMEESRLEKLWKRPIPLPCLKLMELSNSDYLKELPDLSNATNLKVLRALWCPSLSEISSSIGKCTSLQELHLAGCSKLIAIPSSIGNAINLKTLNVQICYRLDEIPSSIWSLKKLKNLLIAGCPKLRLGSRLRSFPDVSGNITEFNMSNTAREGFPSSIMAFSCLRKLSTMTAESFKMFPDIPDTIEELLLYNAGIEEIPLSIKNLSRLTKLSMPSCKNLKVLPTNVNLQSLSSLDLSSCTQLRTFPEISTSIRYLNLSDTAIEEVPSSIWSWSRLVELNLEDCNSLRVLHSFLDSDLSDTGTDSLGGDSETFLPLCIHLKGCKSLVSLPHIPHFVSHLDASNCESLESIDGFFTNPERCLSFANCFKLSDAAIELIVVSDCKFFLLPFEELPADFFHRAREDLLTVNLDDDAAMIEKIVTDVSNKFNYSTTSNDSDSLVGIETHVRKMKSLLSLESNEVRMVGIWGPAGIALEILCLAAFRHKSPSFGDQWIHALPRLRTSLDGEIGKVLRVSYEALCEEDQGLFLHIACFFKGERINDVVDCLAESRLNVNHGLQVLFDKCFISKDESGRLVVHNLLEKLAKEIVRKQSVSDPGKRQFLVDAQDICDVLEENAGTETIIGIDFDLSEVRGELIIDERAFEGMPRLQFLRFKKRGLYDNIQLLLPQGLKFRASKLKFFEWYRFPLTCFPREFQPRRLVKLMMEDSKLEKLWEGPILIVIPSSIGNAIHLKTLNVGICRGLVELPSSIWSLKKLKKLGIAGCEKLNHLGSQLRSVPDVSGNITEFDDLKVFPDVPDTIEVLLLFNTGIEEIPPSIQNLSRLTELSMPRCKKLKVLPTNVNLQSLSRLDLSSCKQLRTFPEISTSIRYLDLRKTAIEEVPSSIRSWSHLLELNLEDCRSLRVFHSFPDSDLSHSGTDSSGGDSETFLPLRIHLKGCRSLVSLPHIPYFVSLLDASNCESLERIDGFFTNPERCLIFINCSKLSEAARELIEVSDCKFALLPGGELPAGFDHRAREGLLTVNLYPSPLPLFFRFKACLLLLHRRYIEDEDEIEDDEDDTWLDDKRLHATSGAFRMASMLDMDHANANFSELHFEFDEITGKYWDVKDFAVKLLEDTHNEAEYKETADIKIEKIYMHEQLSTAPQEFELLSFPHGVTNINLDSDNVCDNNQIRYLSFGSVALASTSVARLSWTETAIGHFVILISLFTWEQECSSVLDKWLALLPFDVWAMKSEIEGWRDYPTSLSMKAVVKEARGFMIESDANVVGGERILSCNSRTKVGLSDFETILQ
ncbi:hypothetical protein F2Q69_00032430, partial [Brassica cretica]